MSGPIWIDLINSPHVMFFRPIIRELHRRGFETVVTARNFAQTIELCELLEVEATAIGPDGGLTKRDKAAELARRTGRLIRFARRTRPDTVLTHSSYPQLCAARFLGLPSVTTMEYEHQPANHLSFRLANVVLVPEPLRRASLARQGARPSKLRFFAGLKEEVSLSGFAQDLEYRTRLGVSATQVLAVVRPPADSALYHVENRLFPRIMSRLLVHWPAVRTILLPRNPSQRQRYSDSPFAPMVADRVYDGPQLLAAADLVISAGGCMNREAAILGTPTFSAFAGKMGCEDEYLAASGRMVLLRSDRDVDAVPLVQKTRTEAVRVSDAVMQDFVDKALVCLGLSS